MRIEIESEVSAQPRVIVPSHHATEFEKCLERGVAAAKDGDRKAARDLLLQAVAYDSRCEEAWMWLASISEYPEELLAFLNNVLEVNPENERAREWRSSTRTVLAKTFVQRAVDAHQQGSDASAMQCLDHALTNDPACEMAWFWKASLVDDPTRRNEYLEHVVRINPDNVEASETLRQIRTSASNAILQEAKAAAVAGKREEAVDLLDEFLAVVPGSAEAWILRSHMSLALEEKVECLEKAIELEPENAAAKAGYDFLKSSLGAMDVQPDSDQPAEIEEMEAPVEGAAPTAEAAGSLNDETPHPVADEMEYEVEYQEIQSDEPEIEAPAYDEATVEMAEITEKEPTADASDKFFEAEATPFRNDEIPVSDQVTVDSFEQDEIDPFRTIVGSTAHLEETVVPNRQHDEPEEHVEHEEYQPVPETRSSIEVPAMRDDEPLCAFCDTRNDDQSFECVGCHATLDLSDLDSLFCNDRVDRDAVNRAVREMEAEWNLREFDEDELVFLGLGYLNLQNYNAGLRYLQEAVRRDGENLILASQVNAIAIRIDEMRRQIELRASAPAGRTILVVDDSATVRKLIAGKLEKSGHRVVCANDGLEALEKLAECHPDLILLDIAMPNMDGYEVCRQIRSDPDARDLPIVMISGKDGFFDKVRGKMAGTTGYVTKPFGPETLMKALETYLIPVEEEVLA